MASISMLLIFQVIKLATYKARTKPQLVAI